jgi:NTP pyrophosphatase (non-canonical NTP hydrolase)
MIEPWKAGFEKAVKSSFEDEIADVAIRLFDLCGGMGIDLEKHIEMKMKYNSLRPYKHGKKF